MLQNELKQQLKKAQLQNKIAFAIAGICLVSSILFGTLLFFNNTQNADNSRQFNAPKVNQPLPLKVKNAARDSINLSEEGLSENDIIRKFDSLAYIIDTLQLSLVRITAKAGRDYNRYITEAKYQTPKASPPSKKTPEIKPSKAVESKVVDNMTYLINNAKKFAATDCRKALAFLYAAQKIAQIDGTSSTNKSTIDQMMNKCEDTIFNNQ